MTSFARLFLWFGAVAVFNCSMFTPGVERADFELSGSFQSTWNEYETIIEFIAEKGLDIKNFSPENDHIQHHEHNFQKKSIHNFKIQVAINNGENPVLSIENHPYLPLADIGEEINGYPDIYSPPPNNC